MTAVASTRTGRRSREELEPLARSAARELRGAAAEEVVAWATDEFAGRLAVASSMSNTVLPHLVAQSLPGVDVLFLETGYHFEETLATRDAAAAALPITVVDVRPELTVAEQDERFGPRLHDRDPEACCRMRKVEPLAEQLSGYEAWVTGMRRDEAATRLGTPHVTWDERQGLVKVNPLAEWTADDLMTYALRYDLPFNPLLSQGYPSIGCAPCTQRVEPGLDARSGRWPGWGKTECGIHR